ncbi:MAG: di-trans,poly-cis-decaprenylcistransferase [Clostridia bacterium]|nr:di-trans,poly-cis-decaprenylcistransferase [Clostridia bacterium]
MENITNLPLHIGIIMDGNGRWAKARGKKRTYGHKVGSKNVDKIVSHAFKRGVKVLSLYAFSSENWERPQEEVNELMRLLKVYFTKFLGKVIKNNVRLSVMGDMSKLTPELQELIAKDIEASKNNTGSILNVAINYGGRQEIVYAVKKLLEQGEDITVEGISQNLYTAEFGEPDLIIRTGGDIRTSNFMVYQSAYSELYFTEKFWPDFNEEEFDKAILNYSQRKRRFGRIEEE